MRLLVLAAFIATALSGCLGGVDDDGTMPDGGGSATGFEPHVVVGISDSGINPYHEVYYREDRTEHPCTYVQGVACDIPALPLTVGTDLSWEEAYAADADLWADVEQSTWYWIPQTVFIGVACDGLYEGGVTSTVFGVLSDPEEPVCILDDNSMHGTGTTSSVLAENPDALLVFSEGSSDTGFVRRSGYPIDIISHSWGPIVPIPAAVVCQRLITDENMTGFFGREPVFVQAAGNDPRSTAMGCITGNPYSILVGGAYAASDSEEVLAAKQPDVVSYYCRPTAETKSTNETRGSYCGTSFAAPTVAGALSKVVLEIRRESGHTGGLENGTLDPVWGLTKADLREALNLTASYDPEPRYNNTGHLCFTPPPQPCVPHEAPKNGEAPWLQWGWGFYDGGVANDTLAYLRGETEAGKPAGAVTYMETVHAAKKALYG